MSWASKQQRTQNRTSLMGRTGNNWMGLGFLYLKEAHTRTLSLCIYRSICLYMALALILRVAKSEHQH